MRNFVAESAKGEVRRTLIPHTRVPDLLYFIYEVNFSLGEHQALMACLTFEIARGWCAMNRMSSRRRDVLMVN
jgi:hypothetical protein